MDQSTTKSLSSNETEYRIVNIKIPKEFDSKGFAEFLKVDEEEFWKTVAEFGVQGWLHLQDFDIMFDIINNNRYGIKRIYEGEF